MRGGMDDALAPYMDHIGVFSRALELWKDWINGRAHAEGVGGVSHFLSTPDAEFSSSGGLTGRDQRAVAALLLPAKVLYFQGDCYGLKKQSTFIHTTYDNHIPQGDVYLKQNSIIVGVVVPPKLLSDDDHVEYGYNYYGEYDFDYIMLRFEKLRLLPQQEEYIICVLYMKKLNPEGESKQHLLPMIYNGDHNSHKQLLEMTRTHRNKSLTECPIYSMKVSKRERATFGATTVESSTIEGVRSNPVAVATMDDITGDEEAEKGPQSSAMVKGGESSEDDRVPPALPTEEELAAAKEAAETAQETARRVRREDLELPLTATDAECDAAEEAGKMRAAATEVADWRQKRNPWETRTVQYGPRTVLKLNLDTKTFSVVNGGSEDAVLTINFSEVKGVPEKSKEGGRLVLRVGLENPKDLPGVQGANDIKFKLEDDKFTIRFIDEFQKCSKYFKGDMNEAPSSILEKGLHQGDPPPVSVSFTSFGFGGTPYPGYLGIMRTTDKFIIIHETISGTQEAYKDKLLGFSFENIETCTLSKKAGVVAEVVAEESTEPEPEPDTATEVAGSDEFILDFRMTSAIGHHTHLRVEFNDPQSEMKKTIIGHAGAALGVKFANETGS